jgi:hypothetical protein
MYVQGGWMKLRIAIAMFVFGFAVSVMPVTAHHSVPGTYDISKQITLQGVVTKIQWRNPHTRLWMDVKNEDGIVFSWQLEFPVPAPSRNRMCTWISSNKAIE